MRNLHDDHQSIDVITQVRMSSQDTGGSGAGGWGGGAPGTKASEARLAASSALWPQGHRAINPLTSG